MDPCNPRKSRLCSPRKHNKPKQPGHKTTGMSEIGRLVDGDDEVRGSLVQSSYYITIYQIQCPSPSTAAKSPPTPERS
jgi:hypothetical protein